MEVDAFLILVLSAYVAQDLGWWVLTLGLMRYALRGGRMAAALAARRGAASATGARSSPPPPGSRSRSRHPAWRPQWFDTVVIVICLGLLLESFGRDVVWLYSRHRAAVRLMRAPGHGLTASVLDAHPGGVADIGRAA